MLSMSDKYDSVNERTQEISKLMKQATKARLWLGVACAARPLDVCQKEVIT